MSKVSAFNSKVGIRINQELQFSKELLDALPPAVSIYGGARLKRDDPYYAKTFALAKAISQAGIPVISGGGTGVMEAANQGAQAGGKTPKPKIDPITIANTSKTKRAPAGMELMTASERASILKPANPIAH